MPRNSFPACSPSSAIRRGRSPAACRAANFRRQNQEFNSFRKGHERGRGGDGPGCATNCSSRSGRMPCPAEQKALQNLLRAEATFRQIQVAFGSAGRRRRGGRRRRARPRQPVRSGARHRKESVRNRANRRRGPASQQQKEIDEALQKLDELARARKNWPSSSATASKVPSSAGSRKCFAARRRSCSARWSRWRATTARTEVRIAIRFAAEGLAGQFLVRSSGSIRLIGAIGSASGQSGPQRPVRRAGKSVDPRVQQSLDRLAPGNR